MALSIEQGNCRMTFEATPEPFIEQQQEQINKTSPPMNLSKTNVFY